MVQKQKLKDITGFVSSYGPSVAPKSQDCTSKLNRNQLVVEPKDTKAEMAITCKHGPLIIMIEQIAIYQFYLVSS